MDVRHASEESHPMSGACSTRDASVLVRNRHNPMRTRNPPLCIARTSSARDESEVVTKEEMVRPALARSVSGTQPLHAATAIETDDDSVLVIVSAGETLTGRDHVNPE